jgi:hypothetical protein
MAAWGASGRPYQARPRHSPTPSPSPGAGGNAHALTRPGWRSAAATAVDGYTA